MPRAVNLLRSCAHSVPEYLEKKYHLKDLNEIRRFLPLNKSSFLHFLSLLANRIKHCVCHRQFPRTSTIQSSLKKECKELLNSKLKKFTELTHLTADDRKDFNDWYQQIQTLKKVFAGTIIEASLDNLFECQNWNLQKKRYDTFKLENSSDKSEKSFATFEIPKPPPVPLVTIAAFNSAGLTEEAPRQAQNSLKHVEKEGQDSDKSEKSFATFEIPTPPPVPLVTITNSNSAGLTEEALRQAQNSLKHVEKEEQVKEISIFNGAVNRINNARNNCSETPRHEIADENRSQEAENGNCAREDEWDEDSNWDDEDNDSATYANTGNPTVNSNIPVQTDNSAENETTSSDSQETSNSTPKQGTNVSRLAALFGGQANQAQLQNAAGNKMRELL